MTPRQGQVGDEFHRQHPYVRVFLDGVEMREVIAYDMDAGMIERISRDAGGKLVMVGDDFATETLLGTVEVTL